MADGKNDTALGLGERLRSARKARALTLEQAAFTLRLEVPVLRALEDERYEALGAAVFVRGHLKAYAKLLGLSEESVLVAYRAADPNADAPPKVTRELEKPLTTTPGPLAIAAAVAFALLAMLLLFFLSAGDERVPAGPAPLLEMTPPAEPAEPVETMPLSLPETPAVAAPEPAAAPATATATATSTATAPAPASPSEPPPAVPPVPAPASAPATTGAFE